ncbi:MAG: alpha/beta fold hydrolase [Burkholderiaceae bacterium]
MTQPRIKSVQCLSPAGLHNMAYKEWGDSENPNVLLCVHGLTRVSDDFDALAQELSTIYRVVCPDVVGRGRSSWLSDPKHYVIPQYLNDIVTLLARLNAKTLDWVGTSMGGLIAMELAMLPGNPIRKLVLNDIGPGLNIDALSGICDYIGRELRFPSFEEAEKYIRSISTSFGPHTDEEWRKLASDVLRQEPDGQWTRHYDLSLSPAFRKAYLENVQENEALLWAAYDAITCPTLLLRGANSSLMLPHIAQAMTQRGPKAKLVELPGIGHAPMLMQAEQIAIVKDFLLE